MNHAIFLGTLSQDKVIVSITLVFVRKISPASLQVYKTQTIQIKRTI